MTESFRYDVEILHLLVSPAHAYFGRAREGAADVPTTDAETVELVAGKGIVGDRFFGKAAHMDAAVTPISIEALEAMAAELGTPPFDPLLTRRNIVLRGAQLAPLIGGDFVLESRGQEVRIKAGRPANPCTWMDQMLAPGAHKAMRDAGACAASRSRTGSCTAARPYWPARWPCSPIGPAKPRCYVHPGCPSAVREAGQMC
jgi:MOSC domain-containing protein YiiM